MAKRRRGPSEEDFLLIVLFLFGAIAVVGAMVVSVGASVLSTATATPRPGPDVNITSLGCNSNPEVVIIKNLGTAAQDLTGWQLRSDDPGQVFRLSIGESLGPSEEITIFSGTAAPKEDDPAARKYFWAERFQFNNTNDFAQIVNDAGTEVDEVPCGEDTTPPVITCPDNIIVEAADASGTPASDSAIVAFLAGASATDNVDPSPTITDDAPDPFLLGPTTVTFTATDASGNRASCEATVTVEEDTRLPDFTCPRNITVEAAGASGTPASDSAIVAFLAGASATDNVDPSPTITDDAPDPFPLGLTRVTFTATDASDNDFQCTATVMVQDTTPPSITKVAASPPSIEGCTAPTMTTISMDVTDLSGGVVEVTVHWRFVPAEDLTPIPTPTPWQTEKASDDLNTGEYTATLLTSAVSEPGTIEYYVEARDGAGNISRDPPSTSLFVEVICTIVG